jgi:hypothetical protein
MSPYRCQSKARVFVHFHRTLPNVISNAPHLEAFSYEGAARASEFDPTFGYAFWAAITNIKHLRLSRVRGYICSPPGCDNTSNTFAFETLVLEHVGFRRCVNYLLEASRLTLKRIKLINIRRYENNPLESPPHYGHDNMVFPLLEELICEKVYQDCFLTRGAASGKWISPNLKSIGFLPNYCDHDVPFTNWIYAPNPAKIKCLGFHINDACITHQSLCSLFENLSGTLTQLELHAYPSATNWSQAVYRSLSKDCSSMLRQLICLGLPVGSWKQELANPDFLAVCRQLDNIRALRLRAKTSKASMKGADHAVLSDALKPCDKLRILSLEGDCCEADFRPDVFELEIDHRYFSRLGPRTHDHTAPDFVDPHDLEPNSIYRLCEGHNPEFTEEQAKELKEHLHRDTCTDHANLYSTISSLETMFLGQYPIKKMHDRMPHFLSGERVGESWWRFDDVFNVVDRHFLDSSWA